MKKKLLIIAAAIAAIIFVFVIKTAKTPTQDESGSPQESTPKVHIHAGFQVYKDDTLQDYSDFKYMHLEPCTAEPTNEPTTPEHEQEEKAHLHDGVGDVVHVHRPGAVWQDLFTNIGVEVSLDATGYINGEKVDDFLNTPIKAYDSLVVFEGKNTNIDEKLKSAVTKDHITEAENKSENCGS